MVVSQDIRVTTGIRVRNKPKGQNGFQLFYEEPLSEVMDACTNPARGDSSLAKLIYRLRQTTRHKTEYKTRLPFFTPNGLFRVQSDPERVSFSGFQEYDYRGHTGLQVMDWDHIPAQDWSRLRDALAARPYVLAALRSPSGDGIKILIRCRPERPVTPPDIPYIWMRLTMLLEQEIPDCPPMDTSKEGVSCNDPTSSNAGRLMYMTYDPGGYVNMDAIPVAISEEYLSGKGDDWHPIRKAHAGQMPYGWEPTTFLKHITNAHPELTWNRRNRLRCRMCGHEEGVNVYLHRGSEDRLMFYCHACGRIVADEEVPFYLEPLAARYPDIRQYFDCYPDFFTRTPQE